MIIRNPAWIVVAGAIIVQGSGILGAVGTAITGLDNTITAVIDIKKLFKPPAPVFKPIKPVVVPGHARLKHKRKPATQTAKNVPEKAP